MRFSVEARDFSTPRHLSRFLSAKDTTYNVVQQRLRQQQVVTVPTMRVFNLGFFCLLFLGKAIADLDEADELGGRHGFTRIRALMGKSKKPTKKKNTPKPAATAHPTTKLHPIFKSKGQMMMKSDGTGKGGKKRDRKRKYIPVGAEAKISTKTKSMMGGMMMGKKKSGKSKKGGMMMMGKSGKGKSGKGKGINAVFEAYNSCFTDGSCLRAVASGNYLNDEFCEWTVSGDASLHATFFDLQDGDYVFIGDLEPFTGSGTDITNADGLQINDATVAAGDIIRFESNATGVATGFEICLV